MTTLQASNEQFFRHFQHEVADLQERIERISAHSTTGGESTDAVEHCSASIARLSNEVRDLLDSLPSHDRQTYSNAIKALSAKLQTARGQVSRKQKFSFKKSAFKIPKNESAVSLHDAAELATRRASAAEDADPTALLAKPLEAPRPEDELRDRVDGDRDAVLQRQGEYITAASSPSQLALLVEISRSVTDLSDVLEPYPTFRLRNISHSVIIVPSITGPLYLKGVTHSIIVAGCHQFRMHDSTSCEVYLHCWSRPIIEDCNDICFAPMPETYSRELGAENKWNQIDDFKWLRPEQSPHWSLLSQDQRRSAEFWQHVSTLRSAENIGEAVKALKLP